MCREPLVHFQMMNCQKMMQMESTHGHLPNLILEGFEYAIIEPCFSANCDLIQAQLVEGSRSMGGDGFGLSVSEAEQAYREAKELMPKNAFVAPPFSFKTMGERDQ